FRASALTPLVNVPVKLSAVFIGNTNPGTGPAIVIPSDRGVMITAALPLLPLWLASPGYVYLAVQDAPSATVTGAAASHELVYVAAGVRFNPPAPVTDTEAAWG